MKGALFVVIFFFFTVSLFAQPKLPGQWSLEFDLGYTFPTSASMKGTLNNFQSDVQKNYNNTSFPFGDSRAFTSTGGAALSYRFPFSAWSLYGAEYGFVSYVDNGFAKNTFLSENAELDNVATVLGAEYAIGSPSERLNAFARLGLALSYFSGNVNFSGNHVELSPTFRGGIDLGIGGRWNWSFVPLALEVSISYLNANLVGKSYQTPDAIPPHQLLQRSLNDNKNPNNPYDVSRSIAYLSFRLGVRIWF